MPPYPSMAMNEPPPPAHDPPTPEELESRVRELEEALHELREFLTPFMTADAAAIRALLDPT